MTICYVAAGRLDGMLSGRPVRSVDVAAAQLIAREAGASVEFVDVGLSGAHLGLDARYGDRAALDEEMLGTLLEVQREAARDARERAGGRRLGGSPSGRRRP